jgi:hypothetical protein
MASYFTKLSLERKVETYKTEDWRHGSSTRIPFPLQNEVLNLTPVPQKNEKTKRNTQN